MIISGKEYSEIQIVTGDEELIASITDEDVIEKAGYKVVCVPTERIMNRGLEQSARKGVETCQK